MFHFSSQDKWHIFFSGVKKYSFGYKSTWIQILTWSHIDYVNVDKLFILYRA